MINNNVNSCVSKLGIRIYDSVFGDQTGHYVWECSSDDETFIISDVGHINFRHELFSEHGSRTAYAPTSNNH